MHYKIFFNIVLILIVVFMIIDVLLYELVSNIINLKFFLKSCINSQKLYLPLFKFFIFLNFVKNLVKIFVRINLSVIRTPITDKIVPEKSKK